MKIGITGATGFIGRAVAREANEKGWTVVGFSRNPVNRVTGCAEMRPFNARTTPDISGLDAVVHLAGESVLGFWTAEKKRRILESRTDGTRSLVAAINASSHPPHTLVSASAIGLYGDRGEEILNEQSAPGSGFLAGVTVAWEREAGRVDPGKTRLIVPRIGFVVGAGGGAVPFLRRVFSVGLGGRLGPGTQWMSLVHVGDVAGLVLFAIESTGLSGPVNAVLPGTVRNAEFTRLVASGLKRPAVCHVPGFALKLAMGEMSSLLLGSIRVEPAKAVQAGYPFRFPNAHSAIANALRGSRRT